MIITRALSVSLLLSTALTVGACKGKDKVDIANSAPAKALKTEKVSNSDIDSLFDAKPRKVKDADAEAALKKLGLDGDGKTGLMWDKRDGKAGNYVYSNVSAEGEDGDTVKVDKMELSGVRMEGEDATFDTLVAYNISAVGDEGSSTIEKLKVTGPSPALAAALTERLANASEIKNLDDLDLDIDLGDEDIHFDAISLEGAKLTSDDAKVTLNTFAWGEVDDSGKGLFVLEGLSVDGQEKGSPAVKIRLASVNAQGIDLDYVRGLSDTSKSMSRGPGGISNMFGGKNPFAKTFDTASFSDLDIQIDTLRIASDGGQGIATSKGSATTIKQVLQPLTIKFSGEPAEKDMMPVYEAFQTLGYDEIILSSAQTSVLDEKSDSVTISDSYLDMKDGFRLAYNLKASGLAAMSDENASEAERKAAAENMEISNVGLALTDNSIIERAFKLIAEKQGSSPMMLKMQAKGGLMMMSGMAKTPAQQEMAAQLSTAVGKFLDDGGTLSIGLKPAAPIKASMFKEMDPQSADPETLGFYAKTE